MVELIMFLSSFKCLKDEINSWPADMWISIVKKKTDFIMDIVICK